MTGRPASLLRHLADPATDRDLLARFGDTRDDAAFAELVRRHGPLVLSTCRRGTRGHHDADDAFQAVFLILARRAAGIQRPELLASWLHQVAVRVARDVRRSAARRRVHEVQGVVAPEPAAVAAEPTFDLSPILDEELGRLTACYRDAIVLCDLQGLSRAEAAVTLGIPVGTLASRLDGGRKRLAALLSRRGVMPSVGVVLAGAGAVVVPASLTAKACGLVGDWVSGRTLSPLVVQLIRGSSHMRSTALLGVSCLVVTAAIGLGLSARPGAAPQGAAPQSPRATGKGPAQVGEKKAALAPGDDVSVVRALSARYAKAALDKDKAGLERLLRPDYHGDRVPVGRFDGKDDLTRAEAVALWTGLGQSHAGLSFTTDGVRVYGATAVESGSLTVTIGRRGGQGGDIYNGVRFTRVWVRDDAGWRVAHESY